MWANEDFLCQSYGCSGCDHELRKNVELEKDDSWFQKLIPKLRKNAEIRKDDSWFQNLFNKNKKIGSGGFATVFQTRY